MILALGLGVKNNAESFDVDKLRYQKIIILTDADVDGAHIRTLLLTFLFRYQKKLFENGNVFMAIPPLYKITSKGKTQYAYDDNGLKEITKNLKGQSTIQRFKGLGEMMPDQLWDTALNPETVRIIMQIVMIILSILN